MRDLNSKTKSKMARRKNSKKENMNRTKRPDVTGITQKPKKGLVPLKVDFMPSKGVLKRNKNLEREKRRVSFNEEVYIRYRTTSEESSNITVKDKRKSTLGRDTTILKGNDFSNYQFYNLNNGLLKQRYSESDKKFDELLNKNCTWSYMSQKNKLNDTEATKMRCQIMDMESEDGLYDSENKLESNDRSYYSKSDHLSNDTPCKMNAKLENKRQKDSQVQLSSTEMKTYGKASKMKEIKTQNKNVIPQLIQSSKITMNSTHRSDLISSSSENVFPTRYSIFNKHDYGTTNVIENNSDEEYKSESISNMKTSPMTIEEKTYKEKKYPAIVKQIFKIKEKKETCILKETISKTELRDGFMKEDYNSKTNTKSNSVQISEGSLSADLYFSQKISTGKSYKKCIKEMVVDVTVSPKQYLVSKNMTKPSVVDENTIIGDFLNGTLDILADQSVRSKTKDMSKQYESSESKSLMQTKEGKGNYKRTRNELATANKRVKHETILGPKNKKNIPKTGEQAKELNKKPSKKELKEDKNLNSYRVSNMFSNKVQPQQKETKKNSFNININFLGLTDSDHENRRMKLKNCRTKYEDKNTNDNEEGSVRNKNSRRKVRGSSQIVSEKIKETEKVKYLSDLDEIIITNDETETNINDDLLNTHKDKNYRETLNILRENSNTFKPKITSRNRKKEKHENKKSKMSRKYENGFDEIIATDDETEINIFDDLTNTPKDKNSKETLNNLRGNSNTFKPKTTSTNKKKEKYENKKSKMSMQHGNGFDEIIATDDETEINIYDNSLNTPKDHNSKETLYNIRGNSNTFKTKITSRNRKKEKHENKKSKLSMEQENGFDEITFTDDETEANIYDDLLKTHKEHNYKETLYNIRENSNTFKPKTTSTNSSSQIASKKIKEIEKNENLLDLDEIITDDLTETNLYDDLLNTNKKQDYKETSCNLRRNSNTFKPKTTRTNIKKEKHENKKAIQGEIKFTVIKERKYIDQHSEINKINAKHTDDKKISRPIIHLLKSRDSNKIPVRRNTCTNDKINSALCLNSFYRNMVNKDHNLPKDNQEKRSKADINSKNSCLIHRRSAFFMGENSHADDTDIFTVSKELTNERKPRTWEMLENELLKDLDNEQLSDNVCKPVVLKKHERVMQKEVAKERNLFTAPNTSMLQSINKSKTRNNCSLNYQVTNTKSEFLGSKTDPTYNFKNKTVTQQLNREDSNFKSCAIANKTIAAMKTCVAKFITPQVKLCNENETLLIETGYEVNKTKLGGETLIDQHVPEDVESATKKSKNNKPETQIFSHKKNLTSKSMIGQNNKEKIKNAQKDKDICRKQKLKKIPEGQSLNTGNKINVMKSPSLKFKMNPHAALKLKKHYSERSPLKNLEDSPKLKKSKLHEKKGSERSTSATNKSGDYYKMYLKKLFGNQNSGIDEEDTAEPVEDNTLIVSDNNISKETFDKSPKCLDKNGSLIARKEDDIFSMTSSSDESSDTSEKNFRMGPLYELFDK